MIMWDFGVLVSILPDTLTHTDLIDYPDMNWGCRNAFNRNRFFVINCLHDLFQKHERPTTLETQAQFFW